MIKFLTDNEQWLDDFTIILHMDHNFFQQNKDIFIVIIFCFVFSLFILTAVNVMLICFSVITDTSWQCSSYTSHSPPIINHTAFRFHSCISLTQSYFSYIHFAYPNNCTFHSQIPLQLYYTCIFHFYGNISLIQSLFQLHFA